MDTKPIPQGSYIAGGAITPPALPWSTILPHNVNIRLSPSTDAPIKRTAKQGERLTLVRLEVGDAVGANGTTAWYAVEGGGFVYGGALGTVVHEQ